MADVPAPDAGLGSGITNVSQQVAGALGIAVLGTIATSHSRALELAHRSLASSLVSGYHIAYVIGAASVVAGIVITLLVLRRPEASAPARAATDPNLMATDPDPLRYRADYPERALERQAA
jgi:hypothetical protein